MKYLSTTPNRWFFLLILVLATIMSCTNFNPFSAFTAHLAAQ